MKGQIRIEDGAFRKESGFEVVERKGKGHPDTLSDELAERLSRRYSKYTKSEYGAILHHNFDKVGILGGHSDIRLGRGKLTSPLRVLLNGRATGVFGDETIPIRELLINTTESFLTERFPMLDPDEDIDIHNNLSTASSPGEVQDNSLEEGRREFWFSPRDLDDLKERHHLASNDTSHGCGFAPLSETEQFVREVEEWLNSESYNSSKEWLGNDIKLMCVRDQSDISMTAAIPQIADVVPDVETYKANLSNIESEIREKADELIPEYDFSLQTNNRDNYETGELYLTAIGSSIESGDEGLVGRGNRTNGLITPARPMSIEGQCGKNPVYHIGRIYNIAARRVAERVHDITGFGAEVHLVSQTGRTLTDPWKTIVTVDGDDYDREQLSTEVREELESIPEITDDWLENGVRMF